MGFWKKVLVGLVGCSVIAVAKHNAAKQRELKEEEAREEKRRMNTKCLFKDGISEKELHYIFAKRAKRIKRIISAVADDTCLYCIVESQSGISTWAFNIDFNDYGRLTGRYWIKTGNHDSMIPYKLASLISEDIEALLEV